MDSGADVFPGLSVSHLLGGEGQFSFAIWVVLTLTMPVDAEYKDGFKRGL